MSIAAGTRLGSCQVLSQIDAGGMGEVYHAHDTKLGRDVGYVHVASLSRISIVTDQFFEGDDRLPNPLFVA
jgi:hypothetical protein